MTYSSKRDLMTEEEFHLIRDVIRREFGILLKGDRRLTLHTRVSHRLSILGLPTYRDYYEYLMNDSSKEELFILASHITNNETYFFRERTQLNAFSELLKDIKNSKQHAKENIFTVLSLASSSGEEAYSLNILIQESGLFIWDWDVRVIGIDIDRNALSRASEGVYSKNSFRSLNGDETMIKRYFTKDGENYLIRRSLKKNVSFRHGNIMDSNVFSDISEVDVIFCRNVFIYLSDEAIDKVIRNFYDTLSDDGYLFIGSSESIIQKTNLFIPEHSKGSIVYRKNTGR